MALWRLANALLRARHHVFKTPMDISRKQALGLSATGYFDEFEPGSVTRAPQSEGNILANTASPEPEKMANLTAASGSHQVSADSLAKREFSRSWLETFGNWRPRIGELQVWRLNRMREKPGFAAHSRVS